MDDHPIVRQGIRSILDAEGNITVVGEAATVAEAHALLADTRPHVAIVDVVLPDGDGIQLCREIRSEHPATACIVLTSYPERRAVLAAALANAAAYLRKDTSVDLVATVRMAAAGESMLSKDAVAELIEELGNEDSDPQLERLSAQEHRVFDLIGQGLSNREIGDELHITEKTAINYVSRILSKLDMSRRTQAAALAARLQERRAQNQMRGG